MVGRAARHEADERKANLDHIPELDDLLAPVFDVFGFAGHKHLLQLFANLAKSHDQPCHFSSRYGGYGYLWDILHWRILECWRLGRHGGKRERMMPLANWFAEFI